MGISEPVLEEEGSLIAGWRAKFGEENHQVFVVGVLGVYGVIVVVDAAADIVVVLPCFQRKTNTSVIFTFIVFKDCNQSHGQLQQQNKSL